jgi:hypothetical protein
VKRRLAGFVVAVVAVVGGLAFAPAAAQASTPVNNISVQHGTLVVWNTDLAPSYENGVVWGSTNIATIASSIPWYLGNQCIPYTTHDNVRPYGAESFNVTGNADVLMGGAPGYSEIALNSVGHPDYVFGAQSGTEGIITSSNVSNNVTVFQNSYVVTWYNGASVDNISCRGGHNVIFLDHSDATNCGAFPSNAIHLSNQ